MSSKILPLIFRFVAVVLYFELLFCNVSSKESGRGGIKPKSIYPYIVLVKLKIKNSYCSGILVTPDWVVTAAHCMTRENDTSIRVYISTVRPHILINVNYNLNKDFQFRDSSKFRIPWGWEYATGDMFGKSDVVIIELESRFNITPFVSTGLHYYYSLPMAAKQKCQVVGFKIRENDETVLIEKDIVVQKQCTDNPTATGYKDLRFLSWFCQTDNNFFDDVFSRSGPLLICMNETKPELAGIAAGKFETSTSNDSGPLVFTDLCPYLTWIHQFVGHKFPLSPGDWGYDCYFMSSSEENGKIPFFICFVISIGISLNIINLFFKL